MAVNRLLIVALSGAAWVLACTSSPAVDVDLSTPNEWNEAASFFSQLISTSNNPIIVNMARENLSRLNQPTSVANLASSEACNVQGSKSNAPESSKSSDKADSKTLTEIKLLPQNDNTFVVPAIVNNRHMATFLIDTGASYTVITPQMARQLGIRMGHGETTVPVTTANGTVSAPLVTLKQLSLGGLQVENVEAVIADLGDAPQLSGLLGMSFFHGMELSFKQDRLVIGR